MLESLTIANHRSNTRVHYDSDTEECLNTIHDEPIDLFIVDNALGRFSAPTLNRIKLSGAPIVYVTAGEFAKSISHLFSFINNIENLDIHPISTVCVVGGGTIQDLAATYLGLLKRGTNWIFIPTTLLAQADSCIGGKTSLNTEHVKNLYGLFHSPITVFISTFFLQTLLPRDLISGIGDALHYIFLDVSTNEALIHESLANLLASQVDNDYCLRLIRTCHLIKKRYIEQDEFDQGIRKILNLGHSFGHAIEAISQFDCSHGLAVLHGILHAYNYHLFLSSSSLRESCHSYGLIPKLDATLRCIRDFPTNKITSLIKVRNLDFINALAKDKKSSKSSIRLILLDSNLKPYIKNTSMQLLQSYIDSDYFYPSYPND
jgi:3-dehydroquinate synthase